MPDALPATGDASVAESRDDVGDDTLIVVETADAYFVAWQSDPQDWVACFRKSPGFAAQSWAEHMADLYGQRH